MRKYNKNPTRRAGSQLESVDCLHVCSAARWRAQVEALVATLPNTGQLVNVSELLRARLSDPNNTQECGSFFVAGEANGSVPPIWLELHRVSSDASIGVWQWRGTGSAGD